MRNTREVPMHILGLGAIETGSATTTKVVMPFDCEFSRVVFSLSLAAEADLTFDILKDTVDGGLDLSIDSGDTQGVCELTGRVFFASGESVQFQSNNEQTTTTAVDFTLVIKPV